MDFDYVQDPAILQMVEKLGEHYRANIDTRFIRTALLQIPLDKNQWDLVEDLTKEDQLRFQGYVLENLYRELAATARLVSLARRNLIPNIRNRVSLSGSGSGSDRILRDMAVNAFGTNVDILEKMVKEIFAALVQMDKADQKHGRRPLYSQMPELADLIGTL
ncbi:MAG: hypothetical protein LBI91_02650 [Spirochaetaceae bacterium]|jgi:hypothetical protein|nr:hypothetical protein [Spirochaetaceae bacterium]